MAIHWSIIIKWCVSPFNGENPWKLWYDNHLPIWWFPKIGVPPKSSILVGCSLKNHPFWGNPHCRKPQHGYKIGVGIPDFLLLGKNNKFVTVLDPPWDETCIFFILLFFFVAAGVVFHCFWRSDRHQNQETATSQELLRGQSVSSLFIWSILRANFYTEKLCSFLITYFSCSPSQVNLH